MPRVTRRLELIAAACMAAHTYTCRLAKCKGTPHHFLAVVTTIRWTNNSNLVSRAAKVSCSLDRALNRLRHRGIRFHPWFCVIGSAAWERATISKIHIRTAMCKMAVARGLEI
ncbi:hypothetical protein HU200_026664 [Digitaria exilis]|uniref:Uncharacterized protein n=1 Tax=Digitaria exilis TaxID=1010633 RepID=A0A835BVA0_9POAL|nr:hypothetical protein HU200_026664 [Digitaria exilis]